MLQSPNAGCFLRDCVWGAESPVKSSCVPRGSTRVDCAFIVTSSSPSWGPLTPNAHSKQMVANRFNSNDCHDSLSAVAAMAAHGSKKPPDSFNMLLSFSVWVHYSDHLRPIHMMACAYSFCREALPVACSHSTQDASSNGRMSCRWDLAHW